MPIPEPKAKGIPYEYRRTKLKVKFCYGCRELKSKESGFYRWIENVPRGKYPRTGQLCIMCERIKSNLNYKKYKGDV